jgi:alpha-ketoglutaric semialdehyde dehydrogenase
MQLHGLSLIAGHPATSKHTFHAISPLDGRALEPVFHEAGDAEVDAALRHADDAFELYRRLPGERRAAFLEAIAEEIVGLGDALLERAHLETGLPLDRLTGERGRTCGQLKSFAALIREGSWVDARIDPALPERAPLPRPDLRRMLVPLGPIVVMGASNFPLAFSTAGGDTASALAAGCPVVVKAHGSHPGTAELVARAIYLAIERCGVPHGVFSLLHGPGAVVAQALVRHPLARGLGFTGSERAGRALFDAAAARPEPIPVFAEMGSLNPVFLLPSALHERCGQIAAGLKTSITMGVGQFCTKPGLVFALGGTDFEAFVTEFRNQLVNAPCGTMLNRGICEAYDAGVKRNLAVPGIIVLGEAGAEADPAKTQGEPVALMCDVETFLLRPELREEVFGPHTLIVLARTVAELEAAARSLAGSLTATFHATPEDLEAFADLRGIVERRVGRIVVNGFPTGVEVAPTMQHGGPYPASSDARFTSVGTAAILRWVRPLCWQNCPAALLPAELQDANPLKVMRTLNGTLTREAI